MKKPIAFFIIFIFSLTLHAQKKINVAVIELDANGVTKSEARTITDKLRNELMKTGRFEVIERSQMKAILQEQGFQHTGCTSDECIVEMGQLIGVRKMIAGSIGKLENTYIISIRMIDISKGKIETSVDEEITGNLTDLFRVGVHNVARKIAGLKDGFLKVDKKKTKPVSSNTSVSFIKLYGIDHLYLDQKTKLIIDGEKNQRVKKSLTQISPGRHVMHNDINYCLRYYYEFDVKKGENYIEPKFVENRLPGISRHFTWKANKKNSVEAKKTAKYFLYDEKNKKRKNKAEIQFTVDISKKAGDVDKLIFKYKWKVKLNGKVISNDQIVEVRSQSATGTHRKKVIIYSDRYHYFAVRYYIIRKSTELDISSGYIDYLKN